MGITKHGHGDVLTEPEDDVKTAAANWKPEDEKALKQENAETDEAE